MFGMESRGFQNMEERDEQGADQRWQPAAGRVVGRMVGRNTPMAIRGFIVSGCHNAGEFQRYCSKMHALSNGWTKEFMNPI
jgi:hypothetical protein